MRRALGLIGRTDGPGRDRLDAGWSPGNAGDGLVVLGATMEAEDVVVRARGDNVSPDALWAAALRHVSATAGTLADTIDAEVGPRRRVIAAGGWTRMSSVRGAKVLAMADVAFSSRQQPGAFGAATLAAWAAAGRSGTAVEFASQFMPGAARPFRSHSPNPSQGVLS